MRDLLIVIGIAAFVVLCAVVAMKRTPQGWEPRRLSEAEHGPVSFHEQVLLDAIDRGDLREGGSEQ